MPQNPQLIRRLLSQAMNHRRAELRAGGKRVLVAGLGNYGLLGTRHSVGMDVLNHLARKLSVADQWKMDRQCCSDVAITKVENVELVLMKPRRFMNVNGLSVASAAETYNLGVEAVYLVHDDLDKPLGKVVLKHGGSARGHNGVRSCISALHSDSMMRLRVGIGRPVGEAMVDRFVLSRFSRTEQELLPLVLEQGAELLLDHILQRGTAKKGQAACGEPDSTPLAREGA
uniref:peptidyl-tRNA hydrolase n=1 Tax=Sphenodon punctatus TaxID=8508 RepID=A0A8D0G473_SPHPU